MKELLIDLPRFGFIEYALILMESVIIGPSSYPYIN